MERSVAVLANLMSGRLVGGSMSWYCIIKHRTGAEDGEPEADTGNDRKNQR